MAVLWVLILGASAIKVAEDVLGGESGPIDEEAILRFIRGLVPSALDGFFEAITLTGSSRVLFPLAAAATVALLLGRRRLEALLLAASTISAAAVVYVVKAAVGRVRPALWDTDWYWGSSFPSGHTLVVAAFATAAALCVGRIWPAARGAALSVALVWLFLVALSRPRQIAFALRKSLKDLKSGLRQSRHVGKGFAGFVARRRFEDGAGTNRGCGDNRAYGARQHGAPRPQIARSSSMPDTPSLVGFVHFFPIREAQRLVQNLSASSKAATLRVLTFKRITGLN